MLAKIQHFLQLRAQPLESKHSHVKKNDAPPPVKRQARCLQAAARACYSTGMQADEPQ